MVPLEVDNLSAITNEAGQFWFRIELLECAGAKLSTGNLLPSSNFRGDMYRITKLQDNQFKAQFYAPNDMFERWQYKNIVFRSKNSSLPW